ncbi:conserved exported hypothetical protein [Candidatus Sulfopaludibacter sp. SbA3]|nr:conserved exported hypothetical protein [Candidatus Sulfopaludibacter sp. SbA3]
MRLLALACLASFPTIPADAQNSQDAILARVAEEAEEFQQNMPKALTQESLEQRSVMPPSRFKPRVGTAAAEAPKIRLRVREIVSEYSVAGLQDSESRDLVEFRQVISVDGRRIQTPEGARRALSLGMQSADDRMRKHMLEEFAKFGLVDIATDYGLILLAFSKRGMENMECRPMGESRVGADSVSVLAWKQTTAAGGELEFHGRQATHRALAGRLWVRQSDGLPLRVDAWAESVDAARHKIRDEGTVDYVRSSHGFLTPASVVHRHFVDGKVMTENLYHYEPFKLFTSDAEIKFTELSDDPAAAPPPPPAKKR